MKKVLLFAFVGLATVVASAKSPYLSKVYDFLPAPGQFVNSVPEYLIGDTKEDVLANVTEQLCGDERPGMISLGAYGGYVIVGFDHPVVNVEGEYDFKIFGNAFVADLDSKGGSCEPGIVMVSADTNGDGIPNDQWYELAGSDYNLSTTFHNYEITYYRPDENKTQEPSTSDTNINDATYIKWTSNDPDEASGYVMRNIFHSQSYWPQWIDDETLTFSGTRLAKNGVDLGTNGSYYYVLYFSDWGYVDNLPNTVDNGFKIDWAVDADGNSVNLPSIDFIKVYTGINQYCGWLGETSTEVCGGLDLHPNAEAGVNTIFMDNHISYDQATVYNISGQLIAKDVNISDLSLQPGVYIVAQNGKTRKIIL
jgi:hypothetical protein